MSAVLTCESLGKQFGLVTAVSAADLSIQPGRVHGVIGKNGAGKSVLMNMIAGVMAPSFGQITIGTTPIDNSRWSPRSAHKFGVALIPQEPAKFPFLTVEDFLFLGRPERYRLRFGSKRARTKAISDIDEKLQLEVHPSDKMVMLPIEVQQMLAFGKAVYLEDAKIVLLDEITSSLSSERRVALLRQLRVMVDERSFVLISHRINEVLTACDVVTVMRDGESVRTLEIANTTAEELAGEIVGNAIEGAADVGVLRHLGEEVVTISDSVSSLITLRKGELVGLAGLEGSGKNQVMDTVGGLIRRGPYKAELAGSGRRIRSSRSATKSGIAYLPKKREEYATFPSMTVLENMVLPVASKVTKVPGLWLQSRLRIAANPLMEKLRVSPPNLLAQITSLSGGNRQKVMIARLELMDPKCYVLSEPTRGVDIGTKPQILATIRDRLAKKAAVLMTSEAEEELIDYCDRIVIFSEGKVQTEIKRGDEAFTVDGLYRLAQGVTV